MSTSINELEEISEVNENNNLLTQENNLNFDNYEDNLEEINLTTFDEILDTQEILDNKFISYLNDNTNLDKDPNFSSICYYYLKKLLSKFVIPKINLKYIIFIILRIIQVIFSLWILLGIFAPNKILFYHIFSCLFLIITFEYTDDSEIINLILKKLELSDENDGIFDESASTIKLITLVCMLISIFGIISSKYSLFNLIRYYINLF